MHGGINRNYFYPESFVGNSARKRSKFSSAESARAKRRRWSPMEQRRDTKWNATSFPFIPRPLPHWSVPQLVAIKRTRDAQPAAKTIVKRLVSVGHDGRMRITLERDPKLWTRGWTKNREASPLLSFSASPREFVHRRAYEQGFRSSVYDAFVKYRRWKGVFERGLRIKASLRDDARKGMKKKKREESKEEFSFRWVGKGRPRKVAREERSGGNVWNIQADAYKPRLEFSIASFALLWPRAERGSHVCGKIQTWPGGTRGYKKGEREASTGEVAIVSMERVE